MKKVLLAVYFLFMCSFCNALNVKIIESQTNNAGHVMDLNWYSMLNLLGHTPTIEPQVLLSNNAFFATTDVLIVSSGVIALPANYVTTIQQFLQTGKPVYIQSEYQISYTTNAAFESLVNNLGGSFAWLAEISGDLQPTIPQGTFANSPNNVASIDYFWYGVDGCVSSSVSSILSYQLYNLGFMFCPATPGIGKLATTTDQDWIRAADPADLQLMENIFYHLTDTSIVCSTSFMQQLRWWSGLPPRHALRAIGQRRLQRRSACNEAATAWVDTGTRRQPSRRRGRDHRTAANAAASPCTMAAAIDEGVPHEQAPPECEVAAPPLRQDAQAPAHRVRA